MTGTQGWKIRAMEEHQKPILVLMDAWQITKCNHREGGKLMDKMKSNHIFHRKITLR